MQKVVWLLLLFLLFLLSLLPLRKKKIKFHVQCKRLSVYCLFEWFSLSTFFSRYIRKWVSFYIKPGLSFHQHGSKFYEFREKKKTNSPRSLFILCTFLPFFSSPDLNSTLIRIHSNDICPIWHTNKTIPISSNEDNKISECIGFGKVFLLLFFFQSKVRIELFFKIQRNQLESGEPVDICV